MGKPFPMEGGWKRFSVENANFFRGSGFLRCHPNVSNISRQKSFLCTFFGIICSLIEELLCDVTQVLNQTVVMSAFRAFWNGPMDPKTTHFGGPVANWGFVAAVCFTSFSH